MHVCQLWVMQQPQDGPSWTHVATTTVSKAISRWQMDLFAGYARVTCHACWCALLKHNSLYPVQGCDQGGCQHPRNYAANLHTTEIYVSLCPLPELNYAETTMTTILLN